MNDTKRVILILASLTFILLWIHPETIPVSIMEARNFITSREMITENHWLLTTMNGEARYEKPPFPLMDWGHFWRDIWHHKCLGITTPNGPNGGFYHNFLVQI